LGNLLPEEKPKRKRSFIISARQDKKPSLNIRNKDLILVNEDNFSYSTLIA